MESKKAGGSLLIVISGPSGVGKDALLHGMRKSSLPLHFVVTVTTRPRRQGEIDGGDYHFISKSDFEQMIEKRELLEWANVYGNFYGVPKRELQQAQVKELDAVVKVDVQGAATIKSILPGAVFIFVAAPSMGELKERLKQRKTESGVDLELRTKAAEEEMSSLNLFDYVIINYEGHVERAVSQIESIITAEKCRVKARSIGI
ncbi:MAG: guanylate kinase [Dehalococcoidia bacterium]|nr:guanylate kinase [Dehalococcoidia bacterium]